MSQFTRRDFLLCATGFGCCLSACSSATGPASKVSGDAVEVLPDAIRIDLTKAPELTRDGGSLVVYEAHVIVLQSARNEYRAFTNVCTHAGCGISIFERGRMQCQCHGSEFSIDGANLKGPATEPLARYAVTREDERYLRIALR